jgi:phosphoribosylformimino-5-aminoimidazole carboxamide ribonucleotide (ProFAR) isomerase
MKKSTIISAFAAILMMAVTPASAQEEHGFKKFNVREDFTENGFQWFHDAELLAAGDKEKSNAMTIMQISPLAFTQCISVKL